MVRTAEPRDCASCLRGPDAGLPALADQTCSKKLPLMWLVNR